MLELYQYIDAFVLASPLFLFIIAVGFRLLDNSGYIFLKQEIVIESSYVSLQTLKEILSQSKDAALRKQLTRILLYRKLHRLFVVLAISSIPLSLWYYLSVF